MKLSINDFFTFGHIYWKKFSIENLIFVKYLFSEALTLISTITVQCILQLMITLKSYIHVPKDFKNHCNFRT